MTEKFWKYYISFNPGYHGICCFIIDFPKFQTKKHWDYYMSLDPDYGNIQWLILKVPKFKKYYDKYQKNITGNK